MGTLGGPGNTGTRRKVVIGATAAVLLLMTLFPGNHVILHGSCGWRVLPTASFSLSECVVSYDIVMSIEDRRCTGGR